MSLGLQSTQDATHLYYTHDMSTQNDRVERVRLYFLCFFSVRSTSTDSNPSASRPRHAPVSSFLWSCVQASSRRVVAIGIHVIVVIAIITVVAVVATVIVLLLLLRMLEMYDNICLTILNYLAKSCCRYCCCWDAHYNDIPTRLLRVDGPSAWALL